MNSLFSLQGKITVITGGGSGIGKAIAVCFAATHWTNVHSRSSAPCLYLCYDEAAFVTGNDSALDGGFVNLNN